VTGLWASFRATKLSSPKSFIGDPYSFTSGFLQSLEMTFYCHSEVQLFAHVLENLSAPQGDEVGFGILVKQNMDSLPQGDGGGLSSTNSTQLSSPKYTQLSSPKSFIGDPDHTSKLSGFPFAWEWRDTAGFPQSIRITDKIARITKEKSRIALGGRNDEQKSGSDSEKTFRNSQKHRLYKIGRIYVFTYHK